MCFYNRDGFQESHIRMLQKSKESFVVQPTTTADDFDYRSILLWLSVGCVAVFLALRILKCLLKKSERQSEEYRLSRQHHEALSIDEDVKSTIDMKWLEGKRERRLVWIMLASIKIIFKIILTQRRRILNRVEHQPVTFAGSYFKFSPLERSSHSI